MTREQHNLFEYPPERLAEVIREVGFFCTCCGKCCTRAFNGHVFLLDRDAAVIRALDPAAIEPAPDPEFCDQNGTFYVSGYALRSQGDPAGSCWFLENGSCRIYRQRPSICRIYPSMLHREPDEEGIVDWRQVSGLNEHGEYHHDIPPEECTELARETKEYENAVLSQELSFLELIGNYFAEHGLRHVQKVYDDRMRRFRKGEPVKVMVFSAGTLVPHTWMK
nr:YkgJ family cysteine cluster protein [Methanolinea mesophila]